MRQKDTSSILAHAIGLIFLVLVIAVPTSGLLFVDHVFVKAFSVQIPIAVLSCLFFVMLNDGRFYYCRSPLAVLLVAVIFWSTLSLLWSWDRHAGVVQLMNYYAAAIVAVLAFQIQGDRPRLVLLRYVFAGCLLLSVIGLMQHLFGFDYFLQWVPPAATFGNKNMAAQMVLIGWPAALLIHIHHRPNQTTPYVLAVCVAVCLGYIFHTETKAAWLSVALQLSGLLVFIAIMQLQGAAPINWRRLWKPVASGCMAFVLLTHLGPDGFSSPFEIAVKKVSDVKVAGETLGDPGEYGRFAIWRGAVEMVESRPVLGIGVGGFETGYQDVARATRMGVSRAHNDYLQTVAELGAMGVALLAAVLFLLLRMGIVYLVDPAKDKNFTGYVILIMLGGLAVDAFFSFPLQLPGPTLLVAMLVAILLRLQLPEGVKPGAVSIRGRRGMIGVALAAPLAIAVLIVNFNWSMVLSRFEQHFNRPTVVQKMALEPLVQHPMFRNFTRRFIEAFRATSPRKTELIARTYLDSGERDVLIENDLALALVLQKRYSEAERLIAEVRPREPVGYYRSWINELTMYAQRRDRDKVRGLITELRQEPIELLSLRVETIKSMAAAAANAGDRVLAIDLFRDAITAYPSDLESYEHLIRLLIAARDYSQAREVPELYLRNGGSQENLVDLKRLATMGSE